MDEWLFTIIPAAMLVAAAALVGLALWLSRDFLKGKIMMKNVGTGAEIGISVGESVIVKVLDADGNEAAQMTLTADWVIATAPGPEPEPPPDEDIVEQTYTPEAFNGDVVAMGNAIIADQEAPGDGALRAVVQWQRGKTYEYTHNDFLNGVQRYRCEAIGQGDRPKLRNVTTGGGTWIEDGPLCLGKGANCFVEGGAPMSKTKAMALIANARIGDTSVTMLSAADASKLKPGRWHAVFSYSQQTEGYPPNTRWIDYVIVDSIDGAKVMFDRPLAHNHWADYWEDPSDEQSVGKARIGLWDGYKDDTRCTLEGTWKGIEFVGEHQAGRDVTYIESHIEALFEDCVISNFWPSMNKVVTVKNCVLTGAGAQACEPDKLSETLIFDGVTQKVTTGQYVGQGSGFERWIIRNSTLNSFQVKPRYLEVSNTVVDSHGNKDLYVPVSWAYNGPILEATFTDVEIKATTSEQPTWTYSSAPGSGDDTPLPLSASSWSGNRLIIPRSFAGFECWLAWSYEGSIVFTGSRLSALGNYGRIDKIYAPADGSALWMDVTWIKGTKPTSGKLNHPNKGLRKLVWQNTRITAGNWLEADFICQEGTPADVRGLPQGIS